MAYPVPALNQPLGRTSRSDTWWLTPGVMALSFIVFIIYAAWRAFENDFYEVSSYLSPFYSPNFKRYFPAITWSPAFLVVWLPSAFRLTCYYGRKAYYRSLAMNPVACAVGKGSGDYRGETAFPWILNNLHRYFLYLVLVLVAFHWIHFVEAFKFEDGFGVRVGSLVVSADTIFLTLYVLSCHSLRHLIGGNLDCFSCARAGEARHVAWKGVSRLNVYHNLFFWCSLFTVGFADFYIRMVASGAWTDWRIL